MISHKHKCIFVEVPKTGSSSIRALVGSPSKPHLNICQIRYDLQHYWTNSGGFRNRLMSGAYQLLPEASRMARGRKMFESYFKFGFVRNPWDRVVSLYHRREGLELRNVMTFEDFVDWIKYSSSTCIHPMPHTNQLDWFVDPHGELLVDFIGKFEALSEDWKIVASRLGLPEKLPHRNRNPGEKGHYTEYYSQRTRDLIARKFCVDIERFEYKFLGA